MKEKIDFKNMDCKILKTIDYEYRGKKIEILISTDEFTCLCPWTGLPDFATLRINYIPAKKCIELKSLKYYLQSYRNAGIVHESAVNKILEDIVHICSPLYICVELSFRTRGGINTTVRREYRRNKNV